VSLLDTVKHSSEPAWTESTVSGPDPLTIFFNTVFQPALELQKDYFALSFRITILYALFASPYVYSPESILLDIKFQVAILVGCNLTQDCDDRHSSPLSIRGLVAISDLPNIFTTGLPFLLHTLYKISNHTVPFTYNVL
jgi:hypothetical protein